METLDGNWGIYDTQDVIDVINYLLEWVSMIQKRSC